MRWRTMRELGVYVPYAGALWLPGASERWQRAPEPVLREVVDLIASVAGDQVESNRVLLRLGQELFVDGNRAWYRTKWADSPTEAALYDLELDNVIQLTYMYLETRESAGPVILVGRHGQLHPSDIAPSLEYYEIESEGLLRGAALTKLDASFEARVLVPYLAARRVALSTIAFNPDSVLARDHAGHPEQAAHISKVICDGCAPACSALYQRATYDREDVGPVYRLGVNTGDDYALGRLTSASLSQTSLVLYTGAAGFLDDLDMTLHEPVVAARGFAAQPYRYRAPMLDGREMSAVDILSAVLERIGGFMGTADPDGSLASIAGSVIAANRWLQRVAYPTTELS